MPLGILKRRSNLNRISFLGQKIDNRVNVANMAARMEQNIVSGKITVTQKVFEQSNLTFQLFLPGQIDFNIGGMRNSYFSKSIIHDDH